MTPYHLGFTCQEFASYKDARKCRFCDSRVSLKSVALLKPEHKSKSKLLHKVIAARHHPSPGNKASLEHLERLVAISEPLADLCEDTQCQERARDGCYHVLPCKHVCIGVRNFCITDNHDTKHIGCMQPGCTDCGAAAWGEGGGGQRAEG